jgi:hypothetical protein
MSPIAMGRRLGGPQGLSGHGRREKYRLQPAKWTIPIKVMIINYNEITDSLMPRAFQSLSVVFPWANSTTSIYYINI